MKQLSIHVTDSCNSKCGFCVVGSPLVRRNSVKYEDLIDFLIDNAGGGYDSVNLHGGEPTIHPKLFDLLKTIALLGYPEVQVQTNARKLNDYEFTNRMVEHNVRLFIISLHGSTAATQDELTQSVGGFEETIAGIRNAKRAGARVRTNTVLTKQNIHELPALQALLLDLKVDHINISNIHPVGSAFFGFDAFIPTVAETRAQLFPMIENLLAAQVRLSLEGFPFCTIVPYEQLAIEYEKREIKMMYQRHIYDNYDYFMDFGCRRHGPPCTDCDHRGRCGGVYNEYIDQRGWDEFVALREFAIQGDRDASHSLLRIAV